MLVKKLTYFWRRMMPHQFAMTPLKRSPNVARSRTSPPYSATDSTFSRKRTSEKRKSAS